jgi:hypothetical protein
MKVLVKKGGREVINSKIVIYGLPICTVRAEDFEIPAGSSTFFFGGGGAASAEINKKIFAQAGFQSLRPI